MTKLVILESPGKIKKVSQFLKEIDKTNNYIVKASIGHIRELANIGEYQIGINLNTIEPDFIVTNNKRNVVKDLIETSKNVDEIILATDPDREGEVISWHLHEVLKSYNKNFKRIRLNSITKDCIKKELQNLDNININYVNSGLSRSYLDKITGYILSRILQDNSIGLSAGRVQSSVLKLLSNREEEIKNFVKEEWFILQDTLKVNFKNVIKINNKYEIVKYNSFQEALNIKQKLNNYYIVESLLANEFQDKPFINFTTSDFLQNTKNKLKLNVKEATSIAQSLFDKGLITYIRTDSTKLDSETEIKLLQFVSSKFGNHAVGKIHCKSEKLTDQEGHPPITPTHLEWEPENIQKISIENNIELTNKEVDVYTLIWKNTVNSALKQPIGTKNTYILKNQNKYFLGETKEYIDYGYYNFDKSLTIPESQNLNWKVGQKIEVFSIQIIMQNSNPKSRFNEATLIKELEKLGIGRPSTYKTSVEINQKRKYVETDKKDSMLVTKLGIQVNEFLTKNFSEFINLEFTKNMEKDLDLIACAKLDYKNYIKNYFKKLEERGKQFMIEQIKCPKCQNGFIRQAKTSTGVDLGFKSCSNYKNCDFKDQPELDLETAKACPGCENGKRFIKNYFDKKENSMKQFETCTNYPNCKWVPGVIQKCSLCNIGWLVERTKKDKSGKFIACNNYPNCQFIQF
ncbi:DNA topoisomerase [Spiroplasma endosymbiont of Atherix ibis]|uniref:type IA DNA topoisomerase n=1 Tax=Spiroplasma endosymbiont of Atherix ibis TaxID=3066291 RepID=UPI0030D2FA6A